MVKTQHITYTKKKKESTNYMQQNQDDTSQSVACHFHLAHKTDAATCFLGVRSQLERSPQYPTPVA
jgi:hypothetical protein